MPFAGQSEKHVLALSAVIETSPLRQTKLSRKKLLQFLQTVKEKGAVADLSSCDLSNLDLRHVNFDHAILTHTLFHHSQLQGATFWQATLTHASFRDTQWHTEANASVSTLSNPFAGAIGVENTYWDRYDVRPPQAPQLIEELAAEAQELRTYASVLCATLKQHLDADTRKFRLQQLQRIQTIIEKIWQVINRSDHEDLRSEVADDKRAILAVIERASQHKPTASSQKKSDKVVHFLRPLTARAAEVLSL
jgi:hypothetical protein